MITFTNPQYLRNIEVIRPDGVKVTVDIEIHSRRNSDASLELILYRGRRITPYEQRIRRWKWTLNALFKRAYSDKLADLIPDSNSLFSLIPKDSAYHKSVVLGVEHGVTFK